MHKVICKIHNYETMQDMTKWAAILAAKTHSLLPCNAVEVLDQHGNKINWKI